MRTAMILAMVAKSFIITYSFDLVGTLPQYFTWWLWPLCTWDFPATFDLWLPESINGKRKTLSFISECHSYSRMVISDFISECHSHSSWPSTQPQSHWQHHHDLTTLKPKPENNIQWLIGTSPKVYNHLFVGKVGKRSVNCQLVDALSFLVQKCTCSKMARLQTETPPPCVESLPGWRAAGPPEKACIKSKDVMEI